MLVGQGPLTWSRPHVISDIDHIKLSYTMDGVEHVFNLPPDQLSYDVEVTENSILSGYFQSVGKNGYAGSKVLFSFPIGELVHSEAPMGVRDMDFKIVRVIDRPGPGVE